MAAFAATGTALGAVTIGSTLTADPAGTAPGGCNSFECTAANRGLNAAAAAPGGLGSPVNGVVTSWRVKSGSSGMVRLRVLHFVGGTTFAGGPKTLPFPVGPGLSAPIATALPIGLGEGVGLDSSMGMLDQALNTSATEVNWFNPPLAEGDTRAGNAGGGYEVLVQATVEPTTAFSLGPVKRNKKKGKAIVTANLPNPGTLTYTHKGVKVIGPSAVSAPGPVNLVIKATGKKRKKLNRKGKTRVFLNVGFTPTGGATATQHANLKLVKKHKKK
ncbi:MAG: hypothetical protein WBV53_06685 [Solirubrobacterales bacterium]